MDEPYTEEMDYQKMYLKMVSACEDAMNILIDAQRECEDMYIRAVEDEEEVEAYMNQVIREVEKMEENPGSQGA